MRGISDQIHLRSLLVFGEFYGFGSEFLGRVSQCSHQRWASSMYRCCTVISVLPDSWCASYWL